MPRNPYGIAVKAYVGAFQQVAPALTARQRDILAAHYNASDHTATARALAAAVGYSAHTAVNGQYGALARRIGEALGKPTTPHLNILAGAWQSPGRELDLTLWAEVVSALEQLRWFGPGEVAEAPYRPLLEASALEGEARERLVLHRERDRELRRAKIESALRESADSRLRCEVPGCGFDFEEIYGTIGAGFIHIHHRRPLAERTEAEITNLADLALVCANCHAMIHVGGECRDLDSLITA